MNGFQDFVGFCIGFHHGFHGFQGFRLFFQSKLRTVIQSSIINRCKKLIRTDNGMLAKRQFPDTSEDRFADEELQASMHMQHVHVHNATYQPEPPTQ